MHQKQYRQRLLENFGMRDCKPKHTPNDSITVGRNANVDLVTSTVILMKIERRRKYQVSTFYCSAGGKKEIVQVLGYMKRDAEISV